MKHKILYVVTVIAMGIFLLTFWAGLVITILSACSVVQIAFWKVILTWFTVLIVMGVIVAVLFTLAEKEEKKFYEKN